jgi:hypothetical protein
VVQDPATKRNNTFVGGGVVAKCTGQDITLYADSAELYDTIKPTTCSATCVIANRA